MAHPSKERPEPSHKEMLVKLLFEIKEIFDEVGIPFFLIGGACLGAIRDGDLIPWDKDIDIGILEEHKKLLDKAGEIAIKKGFGVFPWVHREYARVDIFRKYGIEVDIDVYYSKLPENVSFEVDAQQYLNCKEILWMSVVKDVYFEVYPKDDIIPFSQATIKGVSFNVPHFPEKYLERLYGEKWRIPHHGDVSNGAIIKIRIRGKPNP